MKPPAVSDGGYRVPKKPNAEHPHGSVCIAFKYRPKGGKFTHIDSKSERKISYVHVITIGFICSKNISCNPCDNSSDCCCYESRF